MIKQEFQDILNFLEKSESPVSLEEIKIWNEKKKEPNENLLEDLATLLNMNKLKMQSLSSNDLSTKVYWKADIRNDENTQQSEEKKQLISSVQILQQEAKDLHQQILDHEKFREKKNEGTPARFA